MIESIKIVLLCIMAAVVYGIIHDQITTRVCAEYFTIGHPPILSTEDPTLLGLGWGVIATWWAGLLLGLPLALAARAGHCYPKLTAASLLRPMLILLLVMAVCAFTMGLLGWQLARSGWIAPQEPLYSDIPHGKHVAFLTVLWTHSASYFTGFTGGLIVIWQVWHSRRK